MASKGSNSTPEIKINFSYESKSSAKSKLNSRLKEIETVVKPLSVGVEFKANSESMKSLKTTLTTVKNNLNKLTLDAFNNNLKEALKNATALANQLEKAGKSVSKNRLVNRTGNTDYDLKAVKEAEKESLASIKAQEKAYKDMVKEQNKALKEAIKEQKKSYTEAQKALEQLAKEQAKLDGTKTNRQQKLDLNIEGFQKSLNFISQSGNISRQVIEDMQKELNSFDMTTMDSEIDDFKKRLQSLAKNDSSVTQLNKKISDIQTKIGSLKSKAIEMKNDSAINSLNELEEELISVQNASRLMSNGMEVNLNGINPTIDKLNSGLKEVGNSLKDASGFGTAFKQIATTVGLINIGEEAIRGIVNAFKDGIGTVVKMDSAMADLNKVVDLTASGLEKAKNSAVQMGQGLGRSSIDVAKAQAEFGRVYKDLDTINEVTKASIIGANVMDGVTSEEVAKGLNTVMNSMKIQAQDVMTIIDSMNEVQNNFAVSSTDMLEALSKVGNTAHTAGASLQQLEGYITAITVATGAEGGEVGNAFSK